MAVKPNTYPTCLHLAHLLPGQRPPMVWEVVSAQLRPHVVVRESGDTLACNQSGADEKIYLHAQAPGDGPCFRVDVGESIIEGDQHRTWRQLPQTTRGFEVFVKRQ